MRCSTASYGLTSSDPIPAVKKGILCRLPLPSTKLQLSLCLNMPPDKDHNGSGLLATHTA